MTVEKLIEFTCTSLKSVANDDDRPYMVKYMKGHFDFYGVKSPKRKLIQKDIKTQVKEFNVEDTFRYVEALWELPQRELQYIAIDILVYKVKKLDVSHLDRVEKLIVTKSWWDTVDALAPNIAGFIFRNTPEVRLQWIEKWNRSENMWLNRSAILHQLRYKNDVDLELLFMLVESNIDSKEFFINKATGWALRQASKFYPSQVGHFIEEHPNLSNLTKREGSKYIHG